MREKDALKWEVTTRKVTGKVVRKTFPYEKEFYDSMHQRNRRNVENILNGEAAELTREDRALLSRKRHQFFTAMRQLGLQKEFEEFVTMHYTRGVGMLGAEQHGIMLRKIMTYVRQTQEAQAKPVTHKHAIDAVALLSFMNRAKKRSPKQAGKKRKTF